VRDCRAGQAWNAPYTSAPGLRALRAHPQTPRLQPPPRSARLPGRPWLPPACARAVGVKLWLPAWRDVVCVPPAALVTHREPLSPPPCAAVPRRRLTRPPLCRQPRRVATRARAHSPGLRVHWAAQRGVWHQGPCACHTAVNNAQQQQQQQQHQQRGALTPTRSPDAPPRSAARVNLWASIMIARRVLAMCAGCVVVRAGVVARGVWLWRAIAAAFVTSPSQGYTSAHRPLPIAYIHSARMRAARASAAAARPS
jgi:hypothetical protein